MKLTFKLMALSLLLPCFGCEKTITGHGDCFTFTGKTFDSSNSTALKNVAIRLTDFKGHLEEPIPDKIYYSDSIGMFDVDFCPGFKVIKEGNTTTTFKLDSCKAVFSLSGYENDTVTIYQSDTASEISADVYLVPKS